MSLLLVVIVFPVAVVLYVLLENWRLFSKRQQFSKLHGCQPVPKEDPYDIFGIKKVISSTQHLVNKSVLSSSIELFDKHGETYESCILGQRIVMTCNPKNIMRVLVSGFADFDSSTVRVHLFLPITERGIFSVDGPEWKLARNLYRGQFSNTRSITNLEMLEKHTQIFLDQIPTPGNPFDLQEMILRLILDVTTEFAMGDSADSLIATQSSDKKKFVAALLNVKRIMAKNGFLGPVAMLLSNKEYYQSCGEVHHYVEERIRRTLSRNKHLDTSMKIEDSNRHTGYNLLESLTQNSTEILELRDGVITILIAGIDSVTSLLSTTFFLLARNERVFRKLRQEVLDAVGQETPTFDHLKNLTYLRWVFNETMRVYPPVPFNARTANKDTTLPLGGGPDGNSSVFIKKGQRVVFSSWATHRSHNLFGKDAHEFIPERWESLTSESLIGFFPFNAGPRACPGQQYALAEASYIAIRMLQTFPKIKNCDFRPWKEHLGLNLSNENGVFIELDRGFH